MSQIIKTAKKLINITPGVKATSVFVYEKLCALRYRLDAAGTRPDRNIVVFESYLGRKYSCSPRAFYEAMLRDERYRNLKKVWMFTEPEKYRELAEKDPSTVLVKYQSAEYYRYYARAGYIITNYHLASGIFRRPGQVYVQTWHGTPLKKIGCDVPRSAVGEKEQKRMLEKYTQEGKQIDYMPSPSPFYSRTVKQAFRLGKQARLLEYGYPRNDDLFTDIQKKAEAVRNKLGLPEGKKVILYAPTWRQADHVAGEGYVWKPGLDFDCLQKSLSADAVVLFRTHYFIRESLDFSRYEGFLYDVSDYDEINDLYIVSDLLVTDYSSVFFDYANLWRPILFYMYDFEEYRSEMDDFYFGIEKLPGPIIRERKDISGEIRSLLENFEPDRAYREFNEEFNPCQEPSAGRMLEEIFHGI
ncbi:MAG: CDP-glycerol glycerophosphotransferase family protein [Blautia sp.]|nr:CDP-glycerol glycerophosphotransferase family protein [Blautia sp.]